MSHLPPGDPTAHASGPGGPLPTDAIVRDALDAMRAFRIPNRHEAIKILNMWARRDELTDAQVLLVLSRYPSRGRPGGESR
ncbi:MAG TPA: hypothetical protein VGJ53_05735 [Micromonosporaceae bacterium]